MKAAVALAAFVLLGCASAPDIREGLTFAAKTASENCPAGAESPRCIELEDAVRAGVKAVRTSISIPTEENIAAAVLAVDRAVKAAEAFKLPDAG